jgi:hypothetical protein
MENLPFGHETLFSVLRPLQRAYNHDIPRTPDHMDQTGSPTRSNEDTRDCDCHRGIGLVPFRPAMWILVPDLEHLTCMSHEQKKLSVRLIG